MRGSNTDGHEEAEGAFRRAVAHRMVGRFSTALGDLERGPACDPDHSIRAAVMEESAHRRSPRSPELFGGRLEPYRNGRTGARWRETHDRR
jgi:hypothetical protein